MTTQPLSGIHIAVTRPVDQAQGITELISHLGGVAISYPPVSYTHLDVYKRQQEHQGTPAAAF